MPLRLSEASDWLLPQVAKPNRYIAPFQGLPESAAKTDGGVCLIYPGSFEQAFSHPAWRSLLHTAVTLAQSSGSGIDVCLKPESDLLERLKEQDLPLFGYRSRRPLSDFNVCMVYAENPREVLEGLNLIKLGTAASAEAGPLVLLVGAAGLFPESFEDHIDAAFAGDPEVLFPRIFEWQREHPLPHIPGLARSGEASTVEPVWLDTLPCTTGVWGPLSETHPDAIPVELARGGHPETGPTRGVPVLEALDWIKGVLAHTGHDRVLVSASSGLHPQFQAFLERVHQSTQARVCAERVSLDRFTTHLGRELGKQSSWPLQLDPMRASSLDAPSLEQVRLVLRGPWRKVILPVIIDGEADPRRLEPFCSELASMAVGWKSQRLHLEMKVPPASPFGHRPETPTQELWEACASVFLSLPKKIRISGDWAQAAGVQAEYELWNSKQVVAEALSRGVVEPEGKAREGHVRQFQSLVRRVALDSFSSAVPDPLPVPMAPSVGVVPSTGRRVRRSRAQTQGGFLRYRIKYEKRDSVRFLSHLENGRVMEKAFRAGRLPLAWSQGKQPRPQIGYGPPLPLGMTSNSEYLDITFSKEVNTGFEVALNQVLPEGFRITEAAPIHNKPQSLAGSIGEALYHVRFPEFLVRESFENISSQELVSAVQDRLNETLESGELTVVKQRKNQTHTFNARPSLRKGSVLLDEQGVPALELLLTLNQSDSARPEAVAAAICNWVPFDPRFLRIHRSALYVVSAGSSIDPIQAVHRDFAWWKPTETRTAAV